MARVHYIAALAVALSLPARADSPVPAPAANALNGLQTMMQRTHEHIGRANTTSELKGSGPFPAELEVDLAFPHASIYRPADLAAIGRKKLGVVIWGNGGCADDGASARAHLAEIASHGYLVVAPGRPLSGPYPLPGAPKAAMMAVTLRDMQDALDWALAEGKNPGSPYFGLIDPSLVAAAGHSCGGMLAIALASDPRVKTVMIHNSGIFSVLPDNPPLIMHRERLRGIHSPALFVMGGQSDVAMSLGTEAFETVQVPALLASSEVGHGGTFDRAHGGMGAKIAVDWLDWQLRGDRHAARTFVGSDCTLCSDPEWTVRKRGMR